MVNNKLVGTGFTSKATENNLINMDNVQLYISFEGKEVHRKENSKLYFNSVKVNIPISELDFDYEGEISPMELYE